MPKQKLGIQLLAMWKRKLTKCPPCGLTIGADLPQPKKGLVSSKSLQKGLLAARGTLRTEGWWIKPDTSVRKCPAGTDLCRGRERANSN